MEISTICNHMSKQLKYPAIWLEIDENRLRHNIEILSNKVGTKRGICAVIKGNAYGHGLALMGRLLSDAGISRMAVYTVEEALQLRSEVPGSTQILVLGVTSGDSLADLINRDIDPMILDLSELHFLKRNTELLSSLKVHLKFDTGMNRYGIRYDQSDEVISTLKAHNHIQIKGIASHFSNAGIAEGQSFSRLQIQRFEDLIRKFNDVIPADSIEKHMCNTAGLFNYPEAHYEYSRCGIGIMGYHPTKELFDRSSTTGRDRLYPILSFKTRIVSIKQVSKGEYVGYEQAYLCKETKRIAILPVGYSDGFPYGHSGCKSFVLVGGRRAKVLGRVNMNALMIDITGIKGIEIGAVATLLGPDGKEEISVWDWLDWGADHLYESLTKLRSTLPRIVTNMVPVSSHR